MPEYAVTVYETRTYTVMVEAPDKDEARVKGVLFVETIQPEPDCIEIAHENVWVERK